MPQLCESHYETVALLALARSMRRGFTHLQACRRKALANAQALLVVLVQLQVQPSSIELEHQHTA